MFVLIFKITSLCSTGSGERTRILECSRDEEMLIGVFAVGSINLFNSAGYALRMLSSRELL